MRKYFIVMLLAFVGQLVLSAELTAVSLLGAVAFAAGIVANMGKVVTIHNNHVSRSTEAMEYRKEFTKILSFALGMIFLLTCPDGSGSLTAVLRKAVGLLIPVAFIAQYYMYASRGKAPRFMGMKLLVCTIGTVALATSGRSILSGNIVHQCIGYTSAGYTVWSAFAGQLAQIRYNTERVKAGKSLSPLIPRVGTNLLDNVVEIVWLLGSLLGNEMSFGLAGTLSVAPLVCGALNAAICKQIVCSDPELLNVPRQQLRNAIESTYARFESLAALALNPTPKFMVRFVSVGLTFTFCLFGR